MARALRITYPGAFYHVTSRGNERKAVFKSGRDQEKILVFMDAMKNLSLFYIDTWVFVRGTEYPF